MKIAIDIDDCICNTLETDYAYAYKFNKYKNPSDKTVYDNSYYHVPKTFGFSKEEELDFFIEEKNIL